MNKNAAHPKVDEYLANLSAWQSEFILLRDMLLNSELTEEYKWSVPCYTFSQKNVLILSVFKNYCALSFFKGSIMSDADNIFVQQTVNTNESRQLRFDSTDDIKQKEQTIIKYISEAIEIEKAGLKVISRPVEDYPVPDELNEKFSELPALKKAFYSLTPGRQKAYLLYFADAKQSATRVQRIEKYVQHIFDGKGIHDR